MTRTADEVMTDWRLGHAYFDPYDELGILVSEIKILRETLLAKQAGEKTSSGSALPRDNASLALELPLRSVRVRNRDCY